MAGRNLELGWWYIGSWLIQSNQGAKNYDSCSILASVCPFVALPSGLIDVRNVLGIRV